MTYRIWNMSEVAPVSNFETPEELSLSDLERANISDTAREQMRKAVRVADADIRTRTIVDLQVVDEAMEDFWQGEDVEDVLENLENVIEGPITRSLLSKVSAAMALGTVVAEKQMDWGPHMKQLSVAAFTEKEESMGEAILLGAFLLQVKNIYREKGFNVSDLEEVMSSEVKDIEDLKLLVKVGACSSELSRMIHKGEFRMRLSEVRVNAGEEAESVSRKPIGEGVPHITMFLGEGFLPSLDALKDAVDKDKGMPDILTLDWIQRLPRLMAGVEGIDPMKAVDEEQRLTSVNERRYVYLSLGSLRKPKTEASEAFSDDQSFTRENVMENLSFDNLSFWIATRALKERFIRSGRSLKLEAAVESVGNDSKPDKKGRQERLVSNAIERIIGWLGGVEEEFGQKNKQGILSFALEELNKNYEDKWTMDDVLSHLRMSARALVKRAPMGQVEVRKDRDIADIYRSKVWRDELRDEDKIELALASLSDDKSPLKEDINNSSKAIQDQIKRSFLPNSPPLGPQTLELLLESISKRRDEVFYFRWESIRRKYGEFEDENE